MDWFEHAEAVRRQGNDDVILRWNGCARIIMMNKFEARQMASDFFGAHANIDIFQLVKFKTKLCGDSESFLNFLR